MTRCNSSSRETGTAPGRVRFAADIEQVGALFDQTQGVGDGGVVGHEAAAVGETVRRDVDDAHDERMLVRA